MFTVLAFLPAVIREVMLEMLLVFVLSLASDYAFYQMQVRFQREGLHYIC